MKRCDLFFGKCHDLCEILKFPLSSWHDLKGKDDLDTSAALGNDGSRAAFRRRSSIKQDVVPVCQYASCGCLDDP